MHKQFIVTTNTYNFEVSLKGAILKLKNERTQNNFEKVLFSINTSKIFFIF